MPCDPVTGSKLCSQVLAIMLRKVLPNPANPALAGPSLHLTVVAVP
jgi:hypothetical protein